MAAVQATQSVADRIAAGDRRALARAITWVEDGRPEGRALLEALSGRVGRAVRIGVTGPPGVGKSTMVDALAGYWAANGRTVAVLAVDPSSPYTGGALLGDRVRMSRAADDGRVFVRSMATRGVAGGLARAAADAVDLLDAAGAQNVLIETVGAGQAEVDIARHADVVLLLLSPESGDGIQAMKSGLMEVADFIVINKADRPGAERLEMEIRQSLDLSTRDRSGVPVLRTEAYRGAGVPELARAIEAWLDARRASGAFAQRRAENLRRRLAVAVEHLLRERLLERVGEEGLEEWAQRVQSGDVSVWGAAEELVRRFGGPAA